MGQAGEIPSYSRGSPKSSRRKRYRAAPYFGGAADKIVNLGLERLSIAVVPGIGRDISVVHEDGFGVPVQSLTLQPVTTFENQDSLSGRSQLASQGPPAGSAPDNDDVVIVWHRGIPYNPGLGRLCSRGNSGTLALVAFTPVDACFIAAVQNLNRQGSAEIAPSPIDEGFNSCSDP